MCCRDVGDIGLAGLLVLLQIDHRRWWVVEVVRRVLVLLSLFEEGVSEPVFDHLWWESCLLSHEIDLVIRRGIGNVKMRPQNLQLVFCDLCPRPLVLLVGKHQGLRWVVWRRQRRSS